MLIYTMLAAALSSGSVLSGESMLSGELVTSTSPATRPAQFGWPLPGFPTVVRAFHPPEFRYGPGHRGVDLGAEADAPVLSAGAGTVVFAGMVASRGVVSVSHSGGLRTTYEPVSANVATGDQVSRGERIGTVQPGHPGCPVAVCLHWGALRDPAQAPPNSGREYLDPLWLIFGVQVRLVPIDDPPDHP